MQENIKELNRLSNHIYYLVKLFEDTQINKTRLSRKIYCKTVEMLELIEIINTSIEELINER